jgi:hypothetical protein
MSTTISACFSGCPRRSNGGANDDDDVDGAASALFSASGSRRSADDMAILPTIFRSLGGERARRTELYVLIFTVTNVFSPKHSERGKHTKRKNFNPKTSVFHVNPGFP